MPNNPATPPPYLEPFSSNPQCAGPYTPGPPGCPSYSGSGLASEVCTLRREQRETSALLRAVRKEVASGGGGSGPTAATTQRPGGRTTPPVLDNRVNILENGQLWSGGSRIARTVFFQGLLTASACQWRPTLKDSPR